MAVTFNDEPTRLTHLFKVEFADGSFINQDKNDKSSIDPNRSGFFDVIAKSKESPIKRFILFNVDHAQDDDQYEVDLTDGHFEVNGTPIWLHDEEHLKDFRLIYFRRHKHQFNADGFSGHDIEYHLGWQTTFRGKNYQRTIAIK